jgi:hypothetical protein
MKKESRFRVFLAKKNKIHFHPGGAFHGAQKHISLPEGTLQTQNPGLSANLKTRKWVIWLEYGKAQVTFS